MPPALLMVKNKRQQDKATAGRGQQEHGAGKSEGDGQQ